MDKTGRRSEGRLVFLQLWRSLATVINCDLFVKPSFFGFRIWLRIIKVSGHKIANRLRKTA
jgi:hypothetical protein